MGKLYSIVECYKSLQGEGVRAGTVNVFLRFAFCNLECREEPGAKSPGGFDCDTYFASGRKLTAEQVLAFVQEVGGSCKNIIATGGEPLLQLDKELCQVLKDAGYYLAVETNGSVSPKKLGADQFIDWITCSPKVAEHAIKCLYADEVKYVCNYGHALPKTIVNAKNYLISPAFNGTSLDQKTLDWCIQLCMDNPEWRLSVQAHKFWRVQ